MEEPSRNRLGRGLAALIGEIDRPVEASPQPLRPDRLAPIEQVVPNPRNPRRHFKEDELEDLAGSVKAHGIVQPILVRPASGGGYEIIAGERRWRAAQRAGLTEVPVVVREVSDRTALELAIIENVQRADLNALEEAAGYRQLIEEHSYTQADLGQVIGKSRSHVANTLRLLKLPDSVQGMISDGALSAGHARTLITAADPAALAKRIVDGGLSVRQAEALAQAPDDDGARKPAHKPAKDADTLALERLLADVTGLAVAIAHKERGSGEIRIAYKTLEQLDDLCRKLQH